LRLPHAGVLARCCSREAKTSKAEVKQRNKKYENYDSVWNGVGISRITGGANLGES
jgi:limonene-1,2-epoxide hydrolase